MPDRIEAVLWDFGGVILSSPFDAFATYEREAGLPENFIRGLNARNPDTNAWARMERSDISRDEFVVAFEALRRVRTRHRVACITNNMKAGDGPGMAASRERARQVAEIMSLFEHVVESSKLGVRKPDPRIYHHACDLLGVAPEACVYLDDLGVNLKPARAMGMRTIKVGDPALAIAELEAMVGFALR